MLSDNHSSQHSKTLGMIWNANSDCLHVSIGETGSCSSTKRGSYWLNSNPRRFKTFVGKRISNIPTLMPANAWNHVPTQTNPADCASRGLSSRELLGFNLWWDSPLWLQTEPIQWPLQLVSPPFVQPELKANIHVAIPTPLEWIEEKFSKYFKLLCINASFPT